MYGYLDQTTPKPSQTITTKHADGKDQTIINPAYAAWHREDQQVLAFLLNNLSREVLIQVASHEESHALWAAIVRMFSSQSRSRVNNIRTNLTNTQKGTQSAGAYFGYMRSLADELAAAGKPIDED